MPLGIAALGVGFVLVYAGYKGVRIQDVFGQLLGGPKASRP